MKWTREAELDWVANIQRYLRVQESERIRLGRYGSHYWDDGTIGYQYSAGYTSPNRTLSRDMGCTAFGALKISIAKGKGRRIVSFSDRGCSPRISHQISFLHQHSVPRLDQIGSNEYYALSDVVRAVSCFSPKKPCEICGRVVRKEWNHGYLNRAGCDYDTSQQIEAYFAIRRRSLAVRYEQLYQDAYCRVRGLALQKQKPRGIDYFDESAGWIEFVRDGDLELKDYLQYPIQAEQTGHSYTIVFVGRAPQARKLWELVSRNIAYEVSDVKIDTK